MGRCPRTSHRRSTSSPTQPSTDLRMRRGFHVAYYLKKRSGRCCHTWSACTRCVRRLDTFKVPPPSDPHLSAIPLADIREESPVSPSTQRGAPEETDAGIPRGRLRVGKPSRTASEGVGWRQKPSARRSR